MCPEGLRCFLGRPPSFVSFASSGIVASVRSLLGSRLITISLVTATVVLGAVTTLNVDVLRSSCTKGSSSVASNWKGGTPGLPLSSANDDDAPHVRTVELTATRCASVQGTVDGIVTCVGLHALDVGDNTHNDFGTIAFGVPPDNRFSRSVGNFASRGFVNACPVPSHKGSYSGATILI